MEGSCISLKDVVLVMPSVKAIKKYGQLKKRDESKGRIEINNANLFNYSLNIQAGI